MIDSSSLLANIALALLAAAVAGVLAARLGQSVILGYIVAGILVGPYSPGWTADQPTVDALAAIGIVLLLFVTGMDISVRDMTRMGRITLIGAPAQVVLLIGLGFLAGKALGWDDTPALFLGAVVSNSSSTVLSKILSERGEGASRHGRIGLAWSAVQDLTTIILVVVLTAVVEGGSGLGRDLGIAVLKAAVFLAILVPLGSWLLPPLFASLRTLQQREVFVLAAAALALLTAYVASLFGLSPALGAFVAGIVLSESEIRHEVLNGIVPMRDIFAGLFFVSIGMLLDPMFVASNPVPVLATLALMVPIKGLITAGLAMPLGVTVRRSILAGGGLAQSAEFSFVLASLGASLAALSDNEFSVMLSATALSVVLAPAVHVSAQRLSRRVEVATHQDLTRGWEPAFQDHVIICGYGRVGSVVVRVLRERNVPVAVIDLDVSAIITLRDQGVPAFLGTADNPLLLTRAGIDRAALLVVAVPEPTAVRRLVQLAREANPTIEIVARTHEIAERDRLEAGGVQEAVVGELELAIEMARYALRVTGMDPLQADEHVARIRHGLIE